MPVTMPGTAGAQHRTCSHKVPGRWHPLIQHTHAAEVTWSGEHMKQGSVDSCYCAFWNWEGSLSKEVRNIGTGPRALSTLGHAGGTPCPVEASREWSRASRTSLGNKCRVGIGIDACLPGSLPIHCSVEPDCRAQQTENLNAGIGSEGTALHRAHLHETLGKDTRGWAWGVLTGGNLGEDRGLRQILAVSSARPHPVVSLIGLSCLPVGLFGKLPRSCLLPHLEPCTWFSSPFPPWQPPKQP